MPRTIDFSALPKDSFFASLPFLITVPSDLDGRLLALPQVRERVRGAFMFAGLANKQSEPWRAAAFLRAALSEYCAIEESQQIDRPATTGLRIPDQASPLLHLLELMRHLSIHVKAVEAQQKAVQASLKGEDFDLNVYVFSDLNSKDLLRLREGRHYLAADIEAAVQWFLGAQVHWGAGYVIRVGTEQLAELVCRHHKL